MNNLEHLLTNQRSVPHTFLPIAHSISPLTLTQLNNKPTEQPTAKVTNTEKLVNRL